MLDTMRDTKKFRFLLPLLQIAIIVVLNFIVPLSDGLLVVVGIVFILGAFFFKNSYSSWAIVGAYPITYVLANFLDSPHPIDGRLPNNMYPLWYLIYIVCCLTVNALETILKIKKRLSPDK